MPIRPLSAARRRYFIDQWMDVQAEFVDDPGRAIGDADKLIQSLMSERGYPVKDFEQAAADISVDHPTVVEHFRAAHAIAMSRGEGAADTEMLRTAMVDYRRLFDELSADDGTDPKQAIQEEKRP